MSDLKTVKIPDWAYENALAAKGELVRRGLNALPKELLTPALCPRCATALRPGKPEDEQVVCEKCGYRQDRQGALASSGVSLGTIIGLGIAALLERLGPAANDLPAGQHSRRLAALRALEEIRAQARANGSADLSDKEIEAIIKDVRKARRQRR